VELETFAEEEEEEEEDEEEEDTTELGEVQELGTEILEMILEQVFGAEDVEPHSSPGSTEIKNKFHPSYFTHDFFWNILNELYLSLLLQMDKIDWLQRTISKSFLSSSWAGCSNCYILRSLNSTVHACGLQLILCSFV
jgi:hypothetical protein